MAESTPILWTYLLVYADNFGSQDEILKMLDQHPHVQNWYRCMPNSFFFVSDLPAGSLCDSFRSIRDNKGNFIVLDTKTDRNGWLPNRVWSLMRRPRRPDED